jgi:predicted Fe-S protein YdhL (DUF1289 family)
MTACRSADPSAAIGVPSPCIDVCRIDARSGWCEGCGRTLDEIAAWGGLDDAQKLAVWDALDRRRLDGPAPVQGHGS